MDPYPLNVMGKWGDGSRRWMVQQEQERSRGEERAGRAALLKVMATKTAMSSHRQHAADNMMIACSGQHDENSPGEKGGGGKWSMMWRK